jgi:hypothetical protein
MNRQPLEILTCSANSKVGTEDAELVATKFRRNQMSIRSSQRLFHKPIFGLLAILAGSLALLLSAGPTVAARAGAAAVSIPSATSPGGIHAS